MSHRILSPDEIRDYVAERPELRRFGDVNDVVELGGGYLNRVFRVKCASGSVVLKQSMPYVRVDESWALTPTRITHEARSYATWDRLSPGIAPELYLFDGERFLIVVEDLADHEIWRRALSDGRVYGEAASTLGAFVARVAARTGGTDQTEAEREAFRAASANPEMTQLMSDVIFAFPYVDHPHNSFPDEAASDVASLRSDSAYRSAVSDLGSRWSSIGESLLHGDLHTGSVMVAPGSTKVIDSEFSFYGPVAWDLGALLGNLLLAYVRGLVLADASNDDLRGLSCSLWDGFEAELASASGGVEAFSSAWLNGVRDDTVGYAGLEMVRRIIGSGKAEELTTLGDAHYVVAARATLSAGRRLVLERERITPADCPGIVESSVAAALQ